MPAANVHHGKPIGSSCGIFVIVCLRNAVRLWCGARVHGLSSCGTAFDSNMGSFAGVGRRDLCTSAPV